MSTNNLYHDDAKDKVKAMAEAIDFTMMATNLENKTFFAVRSTKKYLEKLQNKLSKFIAISSVTEETANKRIKSGIYKTSLLVIMSL